MPQRQKLKFPEVKGKTVDLVEITVSADEYTLSIRFADKTDLSFDFESGGVTARPELSSWKTGEWKSLKRFKPIRQS